eukprot:1391038-Amphidinium_carterae.1
MLWTTPLRRCGSCRMGSCVLVWLALVRADPCVQRPRGRMLLNSYDVLEGSMRQRSVGSLWSS